MIYRSDIITSVIGEDDMSKTKKILYPIILVAVFIANIFFIKITLVHEFDIEMLGDATANVYTKFSDPGFKFLMDGEEVGKDKYTYKYDTTVDTDHTGEYTITYTVNFNKKDYTYTKTITVVDTEAPVIETNSDVIYKYYCKNEQTDNVNFQAYDNYDGKVTDKVAVEKNDEEVKLTVTDSSNNTTTKTLKVQVVDKVPPVITLKGTQIVYVKNGKTYEDKGATVKDGCGKELDASLINVTSNVDTTKDGNYDVTYSVTIDDMTTTISRKVVVYTEKGSTNETKDYSSDEKIVYLTFDDGPCVYTPQVLELLDKYNVKATFFVTSQFPNYTYLIKEEFNKGHAIAVHTYTHKYNVYQSVENYVKDFNEMNELIEKYTGSKTKMFRFPGGSSNTISRNYSTGVMSALASYMQGEGYEYFDWNVDSEDGAGAGSERIIRNVLNGVHSRNVSVILCHDIHKSTLIALPTILETLTNEGYKFEVLDVNSSKAHHGINN